MWIELHQTLPNHPKLIRLASRLKIHSAQAAGHLTFLWLWALDYAPTGNLSSLEPAEIASAAKFDGDAETFSETLRQLGWVDSTGHIHDWYDYAGKLIDRRERNREQMKKARSKPQEGNSQNTCPKCVKHVLNTGETLCATCKATVPNQTVPNQTITEPPPNPLAGESPKSADLVNVPVSEDFVALMPQKFSSDDGFMKLWREWLTHRREIKKAVKLTSATKQINKLAEMSVVDAMAAINRAITNGWQGLVFDDKHSAKSQKPSFQRRKDVEQMIAEHRANPESKKFDYDNPPSDAERAEYQALKEELRNIIQG
jgi:hypothetical protein